MLTKMYFAILDRRQNKANPPGETARRKAIPNTYGDRLGINCRAGYKRKLTDPVAWAAHHDSRSVRQDRDTTRIGPAELSRDPPAGRSGVVECAR